jgi:NAD-dependent SIR2 family protein deacetylase
MFDFRKKTPATTADALLTWHGRLGDASWAPPTLVTQCNKSNRPGYTDSLAHEYLDTPTVLKAKVALLATFIRDSQHCIVYSGAGISTSAGIVDYASVATDSKVAPKVAPSSTCSSSPKFISPMAAEPTLSHHALVALHRSGKLKSWIQQNHDGLPQKAGLPQHKINEIHGALYDPSNPVIPMSGSLREDLFADFLDNSAKADLCLALGTSLSGMNCDQCVHRTATRLEQQQWEPRRDGKPPQFGSVIIGLQRTQYGNMASLCIYAKLDDFSNALVQELQLQVYMPAPGASQLYSLPATLPKAQCVGENVYLVPYSADGRRLPVSNPPLSDMLRWDLSEDARVKLAFGQFASDEGDIVGPSRDGHIKIRFFHPIGKGNFKAPMERTLGLWWIQSAVEGSSLYLPFVNTDVA